MPERLAEEMLLEPPLLPAKLSKEEIAHELKECCRDGRRFRAAGPSL